MNDNGLLTRTVAEQSLFARIECQVTGAILEGYLFWNNDQARELMKLEPNQFTVCIQGAPRAGVLHTNLTNVKAVSFDNGKTFIDVLPIEAPVM